MRKKTIKEEVPTTKDGLAIYIKSLGKVVEAKIKELSHQRRALKVAQDRMDEILKQS